MGSMAGRVCGLASAGAGVVGHRIGVLGAHPHPVEGNTQRFSHELLAHRGDAGTDLRRADVQHHVTTGIDADASTRLAAGGSTLVHRDAASVRRRWLRLPPRGRLDRPLERLLGANVLPLLAERCLVALAQQVLHAQIDRVHAQLVGDDVHLRLESEVDLGRARRSGLRTWRVIRINGEVLYADGGDAIHATRLAGAEDDDLRTHLERAIGTTAEDRFRVDSHERAVVFDPGLERNGGRMAAGRGQQLFGIGQHELHRALRPLSQKHAERRIQQVGLAAEIAADR